MRRFDCHYKFENRNENGEIFSSGCLKPNAGFQECPNCADKESSSISIPGQCDLCKKIKFIKLKTVNYFECSIFKIVIQPQDSCLIFERR